MTKDYKEKKLKELEKLSGEAAERGNTYVTLANARNILASTIDELMRCDAHPNAKTDSQGLCIECKGIIED